MVDTQTAIETFLNDVIAAYGIAATVSVEQAPEGVRLNIVGEEAELLARHRGEPVKALQHVVDMAFGRALADGERVFVDALGYRRSRDLELQQTARWLAERARDTGLDQQLGPLNPYERRLVHLAVEAIPGVSTESIGDAFSKTVTISVRK